MGSTNYCFFFGLLLIMVILLETRSSRILTVAPFFATSHSKYIQSIMLHLARKGHDVTVIATTLVKDPPPNYHQIPVDMDNYLEKKKDFNIWGQRNVSTLGTLLFSWNEAIILEDDILSHHTLKDLIDNDNSHFDLVIVEMFLQEASYMFAHKYKAPLVLMDTTFMKRQVEDIMGNPVSASYVPFEYSRYAGDLTILQRASNWFVHAVDFIGRKYHVMPKKNELARKHFKSVPGPLPTVQELQDSASLVLVNTHFSIDVVFPLVPGVVQIGGAHIEPVKKLPEGIQKFLDDASDGAVYFSLGSHLLSSAMPKNKQNAFINVFKKLNQRVIWKWEDDDPPKMDNLLTAKWLPQNDILAHPNVKAFITHGGMLGTQEAIDKGVPIIGIPVFSDQYSNIAKLIDRGVAVELDYLTIDELSVSRVLHQVLNISSYRQMAKDLSVRFRDRQNSPLDTAAYWIEYVIRHKGAQFLKSPLARLPWYKRHMIDVALIAAGLLASMIYTILYLRYLIKRKESKRLNDVILNNKFKRS